MTTQLDLPVEAPAAIAPEPEAGPTRADLLTPAIIAAVATALSTLAVGSLLSGTRWQMHALGAIVLVLVVGLAARAARIPRPAVLLAQLIACIGYVTAFYAGPVAPLGVFPGPAATDRLRDRVDAAFPAFTGVSPPFTPNHDIALLAVAGVAVTAIAVDALSVAYRRPLLAGVPLLVLYAIPASFLPEGPRTWLFVLPALGLLLLFVGDDRERLARWGLVPGRAYLVRSTARRTGVRIGVVVLAISVIVPAIVSAGSGTIFEDKGFGRQLDKPITTLDPLVDMRRNLLRFADTDLLQVTSDTTRPEEQYLRAVTLDEFNGSQWRAGDRQISKFETELPPPSGLSPVVTTVPVETTVRGLPSFQTDYLPMPYPSTRLLIDGKWRLDRGTGNVISTGGRSQAAGLAYSMSGIDLYPRREDVGAVASNDPTLQRYLVLPTLPKQIADTARRVTGEAMGSLEVGLKLQSWFRNPNNFTYDLSIPQGSGTDAVVNFLNLRKGYCEQFAAAMAVMARSLGIPARVNVGFTAGDPPAAAATKGAATAGAQGAPPAAVAGGEPRTISAFDAHAWPELFLPGVGWTRFEPTPGQASSGPTVPQWLQEPEKEKKSGGGKGGAEDETSSPPPPGADGNAKTDAAVCTGAACQTQERDGPVNVTESDESNSAILMWVGLFLLLLLLLVATPALLRLAIRRRRWASITGRKNGALVGTAAGAALLAEVAWLELRDTAIDLGYTWPPARTPRQAAANLTQDAVLHGTAVSALTGITGLVEQARYSAAGGDGIERDRARSMVEEVCAGLALTAGRNATLLARVAPLSLKTSLSFPGPARLIASVRGALRRVTRRPA